jgi:amino acid transporter
MNDDSPQAQQKTGSWHSLFMYTTTVLAVGVLAGHLLTLCPTTGLRAANYSWTMLIIFALMIVFAVAEFISIGYRLKGTTNHD